MNTESKNIIIKAWNEDFTRKVEAEQALSVYQLAGSMSLENFAALLDEFLNQGGKGFPQGQQVGLELRYTHPTIQRLAVGFALGVIVGLAEQDFTDLRNATAIKTAQVIAQMFDEGELPLGAYI